MALQSPRDMGRKPISERAKAKKLQNIMEATLPLALHKEIGIATPPASSVPAIFETQHNHAAHCDNGVTYSVNTRQPRSTSQQPPSQYTREYVRGRWLELRASGVNASLVEWPSSTIPETVLATMKRGPPKYADFAKSVPPQNPFTPASTHGGTSQRNISQYNNGCSGSQICGDFAQPNSVHHYYHYPAIAPAAAAPPAATAPAAAPPAASAPAASAPAATAPAAAQAAAAPPTSEAQQLADVKAMFEQGLIPSHEIYEAKVRQILGLP